MWAKKRLVSFLCRIEKKRKFLKTSIIMIFQEKVKENAMLKSATKIWNYSIKITCTVQVWEKTFFQNSGKFGYSFIKNGIMFMYIHYNYKKLIILSLFKIDTLNFTMYILTILTCSWKTYIIGLHNLISMSIFFSIKDHS